MKKKCNKIKKWVLALGLLWVTTGAFASSGGEVKLLKSPNDLTDQASLQRGAKLYVNYCQGCHALQYVRYEQLGHYLGIQDPEGNTYKVLINDNLNFVSDKVEDYMINAIPKKDAENWFGVAPPDLTLITRIRGTDWLYTYLKSFYSDDTRPWGVNNTVFPDVGMPHVLASLEGIKIPIKDGAHISHLKLETPGELDEAAYDKAVTDLVNFLEFVGEPIKLKRQKMGVFVLLFLLVLTTFLYLLKREYWKDVH